MTFNGFAKDHLVTLIVYSPDTPPQGQYIPKDRHHLLSSLVDFDTIQGTIRNNTWIWDRQYPTKTPFTSIEATRYYSPPEDNGELF